MLEQTLFNIYVHLCVCVCVCKQIDELMTHFALFQNRIYSVVMDHTINILHNLPFINGKD